MVVCLVGLENFVKALKEKRPEVVEWSKVADKTCNVCSIVVIWFNNIRAVKLDRVQISEHATSDID